MLLYLDLYIQPCQIYLLRDVAAEAADAAKGSPDDDDGEGNCPDDDDFLAFPVSLTAASRRLAIN